MSGEKLSVFLKTGFSLVAVLFSCENGGGGFHDTVNNAIIPAVFTGIEVVSGNCSKEGDRLIMGTGETVLDITLENIRNTEYRLEISGDEGFVKAREFDGLSRIRLTLECPTEKEGEEKELSITLHLAPTMAGRAQPEDYRLRLVYALGQIQFLHIIPNTVSGPVTKLVLVLAESVPGLSQNDISVTADSTDLGHPNSFANISDGIYEIGIDAATPEEITVEIAPAGYRSVSKSVNVKANADIKPGEIKFLHAVAHDSGGTTTKLTLVFDQDIPDGLSSSNITITGEGGGSAAVTKGTLEPKAAGVYELAVSVTESVTIDVAVAKGGYVIVPESLPVAVRYVVPVTFVSVTADGSDTDDTTKLTLKFNKDIAELAEGDITLDAGNTGAVKGSLTPKGTGTYDLPLTNITAAGTVRVTVRKSGYHFEPESRSAEAHYIVPVTFVSVADDGPATVTTARLTLQFDKDIAGLAKDDITLEDTGNTGAQKKELYKTAGANGKYTLELEDIKATGNITVTVDKKGYRISSASKTVEVRYVAPVEFKSVTVSGTIAHGKLVPFPPEAAAGQTVTVSLYPDDTYAYKEDSLEREGSSDDSVVFEKQDDGTFTFTMPDADVVLTAQFFQPEAKLVVGGNVRYFETLEKAFDEADTGDATITVLRNASVESGITVTGTVTLVAEVGIAKTISRGDSFRGSLFTVSGTGASLTLDAGNSLGLALDGGKDNNITADAALVTVSNGKLAMGDGVTLQNNNNTDGFGGCGGVYVDGNGAFTMSGGKISGNAVSDNGDGGGVCVTGNSTFTMSGGEISGNTAGYDSGGVRVDGGTFNMTGGMVSGNSASYNDGGGVMVTSGGSFVMKGGTISNNTCTNGNGGGVYVNNGTFTMSGTAVVKLDNDVYLADGGTVTVAAALTPELNSAAGGPAFSAKITPKNTVDGTVIITGASGILQSAIGKFTLNTDASKMVLSLDGGGTEAKLSTVRMSMKIGNETVYFASLSDAVSGIGAGTTSANPAVIVLMEDTEIDAAVTVSGHIKIKPDRDDVTVKRGTAATGSLFTVGADASLTLEGNGSASLAIDGGSGSGQTAAAALVSVNSGGTLTMNNGAAVQNNNNTSTSARGGGVYLASGGTFVMNGGEISGNKTGNGTSYISAGGGGVYVAGGTFTMTGGAISNNSTGGDYGNQGGGVYVTDSGTFTMSGTSTISGNTGFDGGGVFINSSGTFTMSGNSVISNNISKANGGGVHLRESGTFTMLGGTISGNDASSGSSYNNGGGVDAGSGTFTMTGGIIYGSDADASLRNIAGSSCGAAASIYGDFMETTIYSYPD
jgi:hypothetical protein